MKNIFITGVAGGFSEDIVRILAKQNVRMTIAGRTANKQTQVAKEIEKTAAQFNGVIRKEKLLVS